MKFKTYKIAMSALIILIIVLGMTALWTNKVISSDFTAKLVVTTVIAVLGTVVFGIFAGLMIEEDTKNEGKNHYD